MAQLGSSLAQETVADPSHAPTKPSPPSMDLSKVTAPVLLHLLRSEIRFPRLFLLRCRLTVGRFKKTINPKFPRELIDLAALPLWVYLNLKEKIGERKAFEAMRVAILTGGIAQWNLAYRASEKKRTFENLCDAELEVNRTGPTKWNTLEVVERTARRFRDQDNAVPVPRTHDQPGNSRADAGGLPNR